MWREELVVLVVRQQLFHVAGHKRVIATARVQEHSALHRRGSPHDFEQCGDARPLLGTRRVVSHPERLRLMSRGARLHGGPPMGPCVFPCPYVEQLRLAFSGRPQ